MAVYREVHFFDQEHCDVCGADDGAFEFPMGNYICEKCLSDDEDETLEVIKWIQVHCNEMDLQTKTAEEILKEYKMTQTDEKLFKVALKVHLRNDKQLFDQ